MSFWIFKTLQFWMYVCWFIIVSKFFRAILNRGHDPCTRFVSVHGLLEYPDGKLSFIVKFYWGRRFDFVVSKF